MSNPRFVTRTSLDQTPLDFLSKTERILDELEIDRGGDLPVVADRSDVHHSLKTNAASVEGKGNMRQMEGPCFLDGASEDVPRRYAQAVVSS
jgi:hypothetical protein